MGGQAEEVENVQQEAALLRAKQTALFQHVKQLRCERDTKQNAKNEQSKHTPLISRIPDSAPDKHDWEDHWTKVDMAKLKKPR